MSGATVGRVGFGILGSVEMWEAGAPVPLGPLRQRAVLAALLVDCGHVVPVDTLVDRVWGAEAPERAARTLHTYIARLRRLVGPDRLVRRPGGYLLEIDPDRVDLQRFRRLVARAGEALTDPADRLARLREAVVLWRGQPLAGIGGDWAERMRRTWQQERIDAVVAWADAELRAGDPAVVCPTLRELVEEHPLVEPLVEVLMRALAGTGRSAEALQQYAALRERLTDELGADPTPELQATHQALLRNEPTPRHTTPDDRAPAAPVEAVPVQWPDPQPDADRRPGPQWGWRRTARLARRPKVAVALIGIAVAFALSARSLVVPPPSRGAAAAPAGWPAYTSRDAPLFNNKNELLRTLPAGDSVTVVCWYPGNPRPPWLGDKLEYSVTYRATARNLLTGHIPDPYLHFGHQVVRRPPGTLTRCGGPAPRPSRR
jgi:DNA-binding SARP family transcriptional activator